MTDPKSAKLYLHAPNVHQGGGKSLFLALLAELPPWLTVVVQVDKRLSIPNLPLKNCQVRLVKPSILQRFFAELWLMRQVGEDDNLLCFGNLPPIFFSRGKVTVFMQNRYLIDKISLADFPWPTRLRLIVERLWFSWRGKNAKRFIVQTPTMAALLKKVIPSHIPIAVIPFTAQQNVSFSRSLPPVNSGKRDKFLYVASGEPHKNHRLLLESWILLAQEGLFPTLYLTIAKEQFSELWSWIAAQQEEYNLRLENLGLVRFADMSKVYAQADALIYPSTLESFGLPLIEARQAGLAVLAPELDYVRDILDPEETFDPESAVSTARAVKRFLGKPEPDLPMQSAGQFLRAILGE